MKILTKKLSSLKDYAITLMRLPDKRCRYVIYGDKGTVVAFYSFGFVLVTLEREMIFLLSKEEKEEYIKRLNGCLYIY